jgi:hypothetical protein
MDFLASGCGRRYIDVGFIREREQDAANTTRPVRPVVQWLMCLGIARQWQSLSGGFA